MATCFQESSSTSSGTWTLPEAKTLCFPIYLDIMYANNRYTTCRNPSCWANRPAKPFFTDQLISDCENLWKKSISKNVLPRSQKLRNWWNLISCRSSMQQVQPCGWPSCRDCFCAPWRPSRAEAKRLPGIGLASSSHVISFWTTKIGDKWR